LRNRDRVRLVDDKEPTKKVTNSHDDSQAWGIIPDTTEIHTASGQLVVPVDASVVVISSDGRFLRWAKSYED
jgi:hypothetical protein